MNTSISPLPAQSPKSPVRPQPAQPARPDNIPDELKQLRQWVVWKYGKTSSEKIPITPSTHQAASTTDPASWGTFDEARTAFRQRRYDGIGFVFSEDDPFCGADFDNCYDGGDLNPRVKAWLGEAGSYAERSPSGRGVKLIIRATLPGRGAKNSQLGLEIYDRARFFTLTGDVIEGVPRTIGEAQTLADEIYGILNPVRHENTPAAPPERLHELLNTAAPSLKQGGPLRRSDGSLRRVKVEHWLNAYLRTGSTAAYEQVAETHNLDRGESGFRFHAINTLWLHGYPENEIGAIARLFPQAQRKRNSQRWWEREIRDCLYGPKGAATRRPDIPRNPTRGFVAPPPPPEMATQRGRPFTMSADELLRYYEEESGKRLLEGPRRRDAQALDISVATLDRLDSILRAEDAIRIEVLPGRTGRRVVLPLAGAIKNLAVEVLSKSPDRPAEVLSQPTPEIDVSGITTPESGVSSPQCMENHTLSSASPCPAVAAAPAAPPPPPLELGEISPGSRVVVNFAELSAIVEPPAQVAAPATAAPQKVVQPTVQGICTTVPVETKLVSLPPASGFTVAELDAAEGRIDQVVEAIRAELEDRLNRKTGELVQKPRQVRRGQVAELLPELPAELFDAAWTRYRDVFAQERRRLWALDDVALAAAARVATNRHAGAVKRDNHRKNYFAALAEIAGEICARRGVDLAAPGRGGKRKQSRAQAQAQAKARTARMPGLLHLLEHSREGDEESERELLEQASRQSDPRTASARPRVQLAPAAPRPEPSPPAPQFDWPDRAGLVARLQALKAGKVASCAD